MKDVITCPWFKILVLLVVVFGGTLIAVRCSDNSSESLAPYTATRPLILQRVTQYPTPDIQWVGGYVAAIGVNTGYHAALDSTLVWLKTASSDTIRSYATVGTETDTAAIHSYGGKVLDSLPSGGVFTVWLAHRDAYDARLKASVVNQYNFTFKVDTVRYLLPGAPGGERRSGQLANTISVRHEERILSDRYIINWTPSRAFRRLAIQTGPSGGFNSLIWHIITPDSMRENTILPPIVAGVVPPNTQEAAPWSPPGFLSGKSYYIFLTDSTWSSGDFGLTATGLIWFRLFQLP